MSLIEYAKKELSLLDKDNTGMQDMINKDIMEIITLFDNQGHSGLSAGYALGVLDRLLRFKPLKPLTGKEDEWSETSSKSKQNKRCSTVFLNEDGTAEDIEAIIVSDNGGHTWFTSSEFRKKITFPYSPPTHPEEVYIERKSNGSYEVITDKPERIKELYDEWQKKFDEKRAKR